MSKMPLYSIVNSIYFMTEIIWYREKKITKSAGIRWGGGQRKSDIGAI